jgi:hypothetical protein
LFRNEKCIREMLGGKSKDKRPLQRRDIGGRIILKLFVKNMLGCGLDSSGSVHGPVAGSGEHDNEPSGSVRGAKFLQ